MSQENLSSEECDQVNKAYSASEASWSLEILDIASKLYYLGSEQ